MVSYILEAVWRALTVAAAMGWAMLWPLVLGFVVSAVVQAVASKGEMARLLPDDGLGSVARATSLGAASSSCSYAAVAIARSLVKTGADFGAAMAFQVASTNLVLELGLALLSLLGWRFMAASWVGGLAAIALLVPLLRALLPRRDREVAKAQAEKDVAGRMEGHAAMDMSVGGGPLLQRLFSSKALTAISHYFVMDVAGLWVDLIVGLLIAGAIAAWVPPGLWSTLFLHGHPWAAALSGPFIGPLVAVFTFVCSVGNVPLAAVLWRGGASFGGVVAFILGDLIVLPILDIYRKYYGWGPAIRLAAALYVAMAGAGLIVEGLFAPLHLTPAAQAHGGAMALGFAWNATTSADLAALALAGLLSWRFLVTGGPKMLKMMG
jgi:uncharacterized membrane protein YraQ (UPF0718 family)